ncbi:UNVERIFIED_ORG: isopenicillin N synthase-like dioxygenase [Dietzia maris]|jgi:isopenicillin N synthase-like dioxygenase|uniref:isopenicillin N synthase family dioxygenase n=1 Tax=Dietzia maris TaxID=37915 RepID=UPI001053BB3E
MLPIIDVSELDTAPGLVKLREVTHEVGFFYLTGHSVPVDLIDDIRAVARRFFALSDESKRAISMIESPHFRGYNSVGGELTNGHVDWREQIDIAPEREAIAGAHGPMRLQGPNQWPAEIPEFKPVVLEFRSKMFEIGLALMRKWALALGGDSSAVDEAFAVAPEALLKLIKYPPQQATDGDDGQGVGAHKDPGVLTMLLLEPGTSGLQAEDISGAWIDVPPMADAFVVNIGELLEVATGGYLRATRHRVIKSADFRERLSIAYFFGPALDMPMPMFELSPELAAQSRGVAQDPDNLIFSTYGANLWKARARAHPDVYERWHTGTG